MKEYFSHDYGARDDETISRLIYSHGWAGYGLYWALIEMLYQNDGYILSEYERIAYELRTEAGMLESVVCDFGLFKFKQKTFFSESVLRRLEHREMISSKASASATARWDKANAVRTHSERNAIKEKESKVNNIEEVREWYRSEWELGKTIAIEETDSYKKQIYGRQVKSYGAFAKFMFDEELEPLLKMSKQIKFVDYQKLYSKCESKHQDLKELALSLYNDFTKYGKGKKSLYLTLNNWLNLRK